MMRASVARLIGEIAALAVLAGCAAPQPRATPHASTGFHVFIPTGASGYKPGPNQFIVIGPPAVQPPPVYPGNLIAKRLPPQHVCLVVEIDARGKAYHSQTLYSTDGCPAPAAVPEPFQASAQAAVAEWQFFPTHLCTFPNGVDASKKGDDCIAEGAKVKDLPIKLAFAFTFSVESGTPHVHTRRMETSQGASAAGARP